MTVDWSNEEYVRIYTRETGDDLDLSWEALALWRAMLVKFDKSGLIAAKNGWLSIARLTRIPADIVERAGPELVRDGRIRSVDGGFFAPNFTEAQTASKSDKVRQRESRDRRRRDAQLQAESSNASHMQSHAVTGCHEQSRGGHSESRNVTLCSADPLPPDASALRPGDTPASPGKQQGAFEAFAAKVDDAVKARDRKVKLAPDWKPSRSEANLEAEAEATGRGVNLTDEFKRMRDWAKANSAKKSDWDATWRNWTRSAKPSSVSGRTPTPLEQQMERVRQLEAEERAKGGSQ